MGRADKPGTRPVAGIVLVDKPGGMTSNRVLQATKRLFRARKAGHTGTLDPMATGMLPVCLGAATRVSGLMLAASKRYLVTARFGVATDTGDASGTVIDRQEGSEASESAVAAAVAGMVGRMEQVPPMYSAVKHEGRRLYELARQGQQVERKARPIEIFEFRLEGLSWPDATLEVHCSKGTYVRTLVEDLAEQLGTVGHVATLRRLGVGPFESSQMVRLDELEEAASQGTEKLDRWLLSIDMALGDRPAVTVSETAIEALRHGRPVPAPADMPGSTVRIYGPSSGFLGLGEPGQPGMLRPTRIFHA